MQPCEPREEPPDGSLHDPLIVVVQRHSLEDGPGIRSVVFFKGCPLRCVFCHNPEAQSPEAEVAYSAGRCIDCGECARACPRGAIDHELPGRIRRDLCARCGRCAEACPGGGLEVVGRRYAPEQLAGILLRDRAFYRHSGGGVTLSGGECTMYPDYLERLLRALKRNGIHVAVQTSGLFDYRLFEQKILPHLDLVYYDLKIADSDAHERLLGAPNHLILDNLRRLVASRAAAVRPTIPIVPGITATRRNLAAIVELLSASWRGQRLTPPLQPDGSGDVRMPGPAPAAPARDLHETGRGRGGAHHVRGDPRADAAAAHGSSPITVADTVPPGKAGGLTEASRSAERRDVCPVQP